ncbi:hypothetical protein B0H11DRAFT_2033774, partial [Mycena galericulata]
MAPETRSSRRKLRSTRSISSQNPYRPPAKSNLSHRGRFKRNAGADSSPARGGRPSPSPDVRLDVQLDGHPPDLVPLDFFVCLDWRDTGVGKSIREELGKEENAANCLRKVREYATLPDADRSSARRGYLFALYGLAMCGLYPCSVPKNVPTTAQFASAVPFPEETTPLRDNLVSAFLQLHSEHQPDDPRLDALGELAQDTGG